MTELLRGSRTQIAHRFPTLLLEADFYLGLQRILPAKFKNFPCKIHNLAPYCLEAQIKNRLQQQGRNAIWSRFQKFHAKILKTDLVVSILIKSIPQISQTKIRAILYIFCSLFALVSIFKQTSTYPSQQTKIIITYLIRVSNTN